MDRRGHLVKSRAGREQGHSSLSELSLVSGGVRSCLGEIVYFDDRLQPSKVPANNSAVGISKLPFWWRVLVATQLYARRANVCQLVVAWPEDFSSAKQGSIASGRGASWCKLSYLIARVRARVDRCEEQAGGCSEATLPWMLFLDSDAFVRETQQNFVDALNAQELTGVEILVTREEAVPELGFHKAFEINTGVMFIHASRWTLTFLEAWLAERESSCADLREVMPGEQGCLIRLLHAKYPHLPAGTDTRLRLLPMRPFNSPWGSFIRHFWSAAWYLRGPPQKHGPSVDLITDELSLHGVFSRKQFDTELREALRGATSHTCRFMGSSANKSF